MSIRRIRWIAASVVVLAVLVAAIVLPVGSCVSDVLQCIRDLGPWGPVVVGLLYIPACVLVIPASILTLASGFFFGLVVGSITAVLGSTAGACAAFLIGRTIARGWIAARVAGSHRFTVIDNAVGEHGIKVVFLSRLSPISPFVLLNYLFGLTKVSFGRYTLGSLVGIVPGTVVFVYIGAGLRSLAEVAARARGEAEPTTAQRVLFWAGLATAVLVAVFLARLAHQALLQAVPRTVENESEGSET